MLNWFRQRYYLDRKKVKKMTRVVIEEEGPIDELIKEILEVLKKYI